MFDRGGEPEPEADEAGVDAALLARFADGDQEAARVLTARLLPGVLRQASRMLGVESEAEEIAQEAMLRLWKQAPDWRAGEARASTWLYRVTHNLCIDRLRKRRSRPTAALDAVAEPEDPAPSAFARIARSERERALLAAVSDLPERQRRAVVLRHFEEWGNPEIADRLDTSVEAVESLLARARRTLAARLSDLSQGDAT